MLICLRGMLVRDGRVMGIYGSFWRRKGWCDMEQLELPFSGDKPPEIAGCLNCAYSLKNNEGVRCKRTGDCLHVRGKYTERGGMFYRFYNLFEERGD